MILAGLGREGLSALDEKRDKKALGLALVTLPISIISATGAADAAVASPNKSPEGTDFAGDRPVIRANTPGAAIETSVTTATQLNYTVRTGDTISKIARKFSLSTNQLLKINNLSEKSFIFPGQRIKLITDAVVPKTKAAADQTRIHTVKSGETVNSIAKKYSVAVTTVLAMNKLSQSAIIFPGQKLTIGSVVEKTVKQQVPTEHTVSAGETLASVANLYGIQLEALLRANGLTESSLIYVGQNLKLKGEPAATGKTEVKPAAGTASTLSSELSSTDPHRPASVCQTHGYHTVKTGESISKIAAVYGVSTQSLLSANALTWSATIFIGQRIIIPGVHEIKFCPDIVVMTDEMKSNAQTIYRVAKSLNVSDYGIVIALATAMQESGLRNLTYGDRDSVGLFQQRPSAHWGSVDEILNTEYSARAFFGGSTSPTKGAARGLLDIKDWSAMSVTKAAQAVQISAYPNAYAKWEASAWVWLDQLINLENK
jgi:LysM repeat protein